ncbi:MAG: leucine-rich repeat protein, partial [Acutalibacteraceae bacterium]|nr:leucine-rich repeat protein [Acutalibacteraceae bacterium]
MKKVFCMLLAGIILCAVFCGCSSLTGSLIIPQSVKVIGERAFYGCNGLIGELLIPRNVIEVGDFAFFGCSGLTGKLV